MTAPVPMMANVPLILRAATITVLGIPKSAAAEKSARMGTCPPVVGWTSPMESAKRERGLAGATRTATTGYDAYQVDQTTEVLKQV
jgi:hypothetical protein